MCTGKNRRSIPVPSAQEAAEEAAEAAAEEDELLLGCI